MVNLDRWGITPNFKSKDGIISLIKYSKKKARLSIIPKNGKSIPLFRKAETVFKFNQKKFRHTTMGSYSFSRNKKRRTLLTQGFQVVIEKL